MRGLWFFWDGFQHEDTKTRRHEDGFRASCRPHSPRPVLAQEVKVEFKRPQFVLL